MGVREMPGVGDRGSRSWTMPAGGSAGLGCGLPAGELTTCGEGSRGGGGPEPHRGKRRREGSYLDGGAQDAGGGGAGVADMRQVLVAERGRGGGGAAGGPHGGGGRTASLPRRTRRSNLPRAGRCRRPLAALRGRGSLCHAHLPAPPARLLRSPRLSRPASPRCQSPGTDPPPRPALRHYWSRSPAPPPEMAGGRLRLGEPAGRHGESGLQPHCRLARTRLIAPGCDWAGRGCGRCRGEPLSWRS